MVDWLAIIKLKGLWKEAVMTYHRYYHDICLEKLRKKMRNRSQSSLCPGRVSHPALHEYKSTALPPHQHARPSSSVCISGRGPTSFTRRPKFGELMRQDGDDERKHSSLRRNWGLRPYSSSKIKQIYHAYKIGETKEQRRRPSSA
jgi:hypothetical protein